MTMHKPVRIVNNALTSFKEQTKKTEHSLRFYSIQRNDDYIEKSSMRGLESPDRWDLSFIFFFFGGEKNGRTKKNPEYNKRLPGDVSFSLRLTYSWRLLVISFCIHPKSND